MYRLLIHELLRHVQVLHEHPDVALHLREVPELFAEVADQVLDLVSKDPKQGLVEHVLFYSRGVVLKLYLADEFWWR